MLLAVTRCSQSPYLNRPSHSLEAALRDIDWMKQQGKEMAEKVDR